MRLKLPKPPAKPKWWTDRWKETYFVKKKINISRWYLIKKRKRKIRSFTIDDEVFNRLKKEAKKNEDSMSRFLEESLKKSFKKSS